MCNSDDFQKYSSLNSFLRLRGNVPTRLRACLHRRDFLGSINRNVAVPNILADIIEIAAFSIHRGTYTRCKLVPIKFIAALANEKEVHAEWMRERVGEIESRHVRNTRM